MKKIKILLPAVFLSVLLFMNNANAVNNGSSVIHKNNATTKMVSEDAIVDGVSKFLLDRAETNLIYVFDKKIKNSEDFKCYFPNTRGQLKYGQLQEWLLFPRDMWKGSIEKDIELFALRSTAINLERNLKLSSKASALADDYLKLINDLVVEYEGKNYSLAVVDIPDPKKTKQEKIKEKAKLDRINGFSIHLGKIVSALNIFRKYTSPCESPKDGLLEFKKLISGILNYNKNINAFKQHVSKNGKYLHISEKKVKEFCDDNDLVGDCSSEKAAIRLFVAKLEKNINKQLSRTFIGRLQRLNSDINQVLNEIRAQESYTGKVKVLLDKLDESNDLDTTDMKKLSRAALFFAAISDSKSGDEVSVILQAYTLQPVSFYTKRETGHHVNITAYLGLAGGLYDKNIEPKEPLSIFAPVGIEYSEGFNDGGSWSLMISPFDFGYPITQHLNGNKENSNFNDILAPSLMLSYGFKDLPLTVGAGYQQGRYITSLNKTERRVLFFLAFDMPLFNIN